MVVDSSDHIFVAGKTCSTLSGATSEGSCDAFIMKLSADGTFDWTKQYGTTGSDIGYSLVLDSGYFYLMGRTSGTFPDQTKIGGSDTWVMQVDTSGTQQWAVQTGTNSADSVGMLDKQVAVDSSGNVYTAFDAFDASVEGQTKIGNFDWVLWRIDAKTTTTSSVTTATMTTSTSTSFTSTISTSVGILASQASSIFYKHEKDWSENEMS